MARGRAPSEAELAIWAAFAREIRPLPGRLIPSAALPAEAPPPATPSPSLPPARAPQPRRAAPLAPLAIGVAPGGLDAATWERLRSGKLRPARVIDLHGLTLAEAHRALLAAIAKARAEKLRCIEIVTGRGRGEEGGAIRREWVHWLNRPDLRPQILAAAHPHAANPGATRLLLRK